MTGSPAMASSRVGETFEAWDGYITGENLTLEPGRRIVQSWRTTEFTADEQDSRLDILLVPAFEQTRLVLRHSNLPEHGTQYEQGWEDAYFTPMKSYFRLETKK
jgi:activator of HSP90 ATPase